MMMEAIRPRSNDPAFVSFAAEKLAEDCAEWCGESAPDEWRDDLVSVLRRNPHGNGYEIARDLERKRFVEPDAELVEILDSAGSYIWQAHKEAVKAWVGEVGFSPAYRIGETVECRHGRGPIVSILHEEASYVIDTEGRGNGGYIINAEDVRPCDSDGNPQGGDANAAPGKA